MFNSFNSALSALKAHSAAVDAVGNNLANVNTTGFKSSDVAFKDVVAESFSGGSETGLGVGRPTTIRNFSQGAIQSTSGTLDAALQGNGFFVVKESATSVQPVLTRDGSFKLDTDGFVVTTTGQRVQQFANGALSDIQVPTGVSPAKPTSTLDMVANLNASAAIGDTFSQPIDVVDSLGSRHVVTFTFTKTAANAWEVLPSMSDADFATPPGVITPAAPTALTFDSAGKMTAPAIAARVIAIGIPGLATGAADLAIDFDLYDAKGLPKFTQFAEASDVSKSSQNGYPAASVASVGLLNGGKVVARYGNGQEKELGSLAVAMVANIASLTAVGDNFLRVTSDSAQPLYGVAEAGGRAKIKAGALEGSNVDIAREFTNLIVYQRGYQANSRVITTTDEITQETLTLKR
ncbi:MAG: flagellar hook protein FlgE [Bryobacteraceae bacterium]|nr:flagellar hook protein FlgE [Bryobacteraceae bacterium]